MMKNNNKTDHDMFMLNFHFRFQKMLLLGYIMNGAQQKVLQNRQLEGIHSRARQVCDIFLIFK